MNGRNREVMAHLALAISRYEKEAKREGFRVPDEVGWVLAFVMDCAQTRQRATPIDDGAPTPDSGGMANNLLLRKREAASMLQVSIRTLERLIASGALEAVSVESTTRVRRTDLEAYVAGLSSRAGFRTDVSTKEIA